MNSSDVLNIILIIGVVVIVAWISLVSFFVIQTLRIIKRIADDLENGAKNLSFLKGKLTVGVLGIFSSILVTILSRLIKKGR